MTEPRAFDQYEDSLPCGQNAVNLVSDWISHFPPNTGIVAGSMPLFQDERISWAIEKIGSVYGRNVLELGPLEGGHTFMLDAAGAHVDAIEANKQAFIRCLITKEVVRLQRAKFYLGNFVKWLEHVPKSYDLIVASGVLYHMEDPLKLLKLIASRCEALYLWTHYFSDAQMPLGDSRRGAFVGPPEIVKFRDVDVRLYRRTYGGNQTTTSFCGGPVDQHRWIDRDDLLEVLTVLGFGDISINHDDHVNANGPAFSIFAKKQPLNPI